MFSTTDLTPADLQPLKPTDTPAGADAELVWYDLRDMLIEGKGWDDTASFYDRMPARAEGTVSNDVWGGSRQSAGICARFLTDAEAISAHWTLRNEALGMAHMPATGVSGLDLYVNDSGVWRWLGIGLPDMFPANTKPLTAGIPVGLYEFLLYLPLYNGVNEVLIGLPKHAAIYRATPNPAGPICFYGTSITQGGCASRPGMAHPAILGRRFNCPVINLGFSGSGKLDPEVIELMTELDPCAYVLDCLPNLSGPDMVRERTRPSVMRLREARPNTPILLVENVPYQADFIPATRESYVSKNAILREEYEKLLADGVGGLHYLFCDALYGDDHESTVDGCHATDLGFYRMAAAFEPLLREMIGK